MDEIKSMEVSSRETFDSLANTQSHCVKLNCDGLAGKEITITEAYLKGRLDLGFCFDVSHVPSLPSWDTRKINHEQIGNAVREAQNSGATNINSWLDGMHLIGSQIAGVPNKENQLVLVCYVHQMQGVKEFIAAKIRLNGFDFINDLFAGQLYFSLCEGGIKAGLLCAERELRSDGVFCFVANHSKDDEIKSASQIMDGIPHDQGECIWNGFIAFDCNGALHSLWVINNDEFERTLRKEGIKLPVQVIDVIAGPLDFKTRGPQ